MDSSSKDSHPPMGASKDSHPPWGAPTLTDLPREIILEIVDLVNDLDIIALRQVHPSLSGLPVHLTNELPGLNRVDANGIINYPAIHSFMGFKYGMDWFFNLHGVYPGYNNIRRLEIRRAKDISGPLPLALEELYITPETEEYQYTPARVNLLPLKRMRVLKCLDNGAIFLNIPPGLQTIEVDLMNVPNWAEVPRGLRRLKVTNRKISTTPVPEIDFLEFTELEELEVFTDLQGIELPAKLKRVTCAGFTGIVSPLEDREPFEEIHVYDVVMQRPDSSIPWDPRVHLATLQCSIDHYDLSKFSGLVELIMGASEGDNKLPPNLQKLTITGGDIPDFVGLHHLQYLNLREVNTGEFSIGDIPPTISHLSLENMRFSQDDARIDFSRLTNLVYIKIGKNRAPYRADNELFLSCDLSGNHKLEKISLSHVKVVGLLPRSLKEIHIRHCDLEYTLSGLDRLTTMIIERVLNFDLMFPRNLKNLYLTGIEGTDLDHFYLSNLRSLKTLSLTKSSLIGPLPDTITELSIIDHRQDIDLSHLHRLKSLEISLWAPRDKQVSHKYIGPLPTSLRHLNLRSTSHRFDLTNLTNLESLGINNRNIVGTIPPSIKLLITSYASAEEIVLPNLREHRRAFPIKF